MKIFYYKPVNITVDISKLAKIIINVVIRYYDIPDIIIIDKSLIFILKFWLLFCYFIKIKQKLSIAFYSQINGQTKI